MLEEQRCIILIVGQISSGKTTGAFCLREMGFNVISASNIIKEECLSQGLQPSRRNLQDFGLKYIQDEGCEYFTRVLLQRMSNSKKVVFDGIRPIEAIKRIKTVLPNLIIIYVDSSEKVRKERYQLSEQGSATEYDEVVSHLVERQVLESKSIADIVLENNDDVAIYYQRLRDIVDHYC